MNGYYLLEHILRDVLRVVNPSEEDWLIRFHIINEVRAIAESIESLRGATVEPFGSFVSNLFTKWGDLDISIELQNGSYISCPGKKHKQSLLGDVLSALRKRGGFRKLQFIFNARVPILKFESSYNISCDISINNLSGQMKSKVLFWINGIDGRFRDLVKEWAKNHHINDSKSGTLNSYSLSLLVVFHLQTVEPAILPPLRDIYPENMIDGLTGVRTDAEKHIEDICAVNINRFKSNEFRMNRSSLSELFLSFLSKFSEICSSASTHGVCPFSGQLEDIDSNMRWLPKTYALFVEDPFEQPANSARTVSKNQLTKISEAIQATRETLNPSNQNQASLLSVLVGPHISCLLVKTPVPTPVTRQPAPRRPATNNGNKARPERRKQGTLPPPSQTLPSTQTKHQNGATNGLPHASSSKKQNGASTWKRQNGESNGLPHASSSHKQNGAPVDLPHASSSQKQQVWRPKPRKTDG